MQLFLNWFNDTQKMDPIIKAAIAHLWFVTIHPFEDGNGRIARAIADLMLARSEDSSYRFYSLSAQIQKQRKRYYTILEETQKGNLNITLWLEWFLLCLKNAIEEALIALNLTLQKMHFWHDHKDLVFNERQNKILNNLLDGFEGKLTSSKWAILGKCSQDTAGRDILDLLKKGVLIKSEEMGRSTHYRLKNQI